MSSRTPARVICEEDSKPANQKESNSLETTVSDVKRAAPLPFWDTDGTCTSGAVLSVAGNSGVIGPFSQSALVLQLGPAPAGHINRVGGKRTIILAALLT